MNKVLWLGVITLLVFGMITPGYASWETSLYIDGEVQVIQLGSELRWACVETFEKNAKVQSGVTGRVLTVDIAQGANSNQEIDVVGVIQNTTKYTIRVYLEWSCDHPDGEIVGLPGYVDVAPGTVEVDFTIIRHTVRAQTYEVTFTT